MYCKKCHHILEMGSSICPNCHYDNSIDNNDNLNSFNDNSKKNNNKNEIIKITLTIALIFVLALILNYLLTLTKTNDNNQITTTQSYTTIEELHKYSFESLSVYYPDNFGSTNSTIFYKNNSNINITFSVITDDEYSAIVNSNEVLDATLNSNINVKTYANDNSYGYLLDYNNIKYNIIVNYVSDKTIYTEEVQTSIGKILNSIELK